MDSQNSQNERSPDDTEADAEESMEMIVNRVKRAIDNLVRRFHVATQGQNVLISYKTLKKWGSIKFPRGVGWLLLIIGIIVLAGHWWKMKEAINASNEALTEQIAKSQELSNIYARRASIKGQPKDNYTMENYSKEREDTNAKISELYSKMGTNTKAALTGNSGGFGPWGKVFAPWFEGGVDEQQMIEAKQ